ncbi:hypothetical protein [Hymenobacter antarcticus]|uniref:hypothetical protein n=1 Tax=Hymenobacter antarcticus TaxID=486270 RepID=UPI003CD08980
MVAETAVGGAAQVLSPKLAPVGVAVLIFAAGLVIKAPLGAVAKIAAVGPAAWFQALGVGFLVFARAALLVYGTIGHARFGGRQGLTRCGSGVRSGGSGRPAGQARASTGPAGLGRGIAHGAIDAIARDVVFLSIQVDGFVFHDVQKNRE